MKKFLLFLFAMTLFLAGSVFAQWVQTSAVPTAQVRSISINGSNILVGSMKGWAFGPSGGVYYSTNGGTTFTKTAVTPNTSIWSVLLTGTSFLAGSDAGGIHLSTNNGASWTNPLPGKSVRAFASDGAGNLYAAGYPNGVWRSTNNGASWAVVGTPSGNLLSIVVVGSNIFVGANSAGIYRSSDGGTTWTQPLTASTNVWSFTTIGSTIFANSTTGLYSSTDDGLTWTLVSNPGSSWQACPIVAVGTTLLVGTSTGVKRSTDLGATWTDVNTGLTVEVAGLAADNQYAYAGSGGYTLTGVFWRRPLSEMIFASCVNPTIAGVIAGDQVSCGSFDPAITTSTTPASGETGTLEYKWQSSVSPFTTWVDIAASNAATYNPGVLTQTTKYKRLARVTCKLDWTGAVESNVVTKTINPIPSVTPVNPAPICSGTSPAINLSSAVPSTFTWTVGNITGGVTGASASVGNQTTINQVLTNAGPAVGTVQYLVTPTSVTGTCAGATYPITVTVNPITQVSVSIIGQNQVCAGTSVLYAAFPNIPGAHSYQWKVNGTPQGAGNTFSYAPANGNVITCELTPDPLVVCPSVSVATSNQINMVVNTNVTPTISIGTTTSSVCAGGSLNFSATVNNEGGTPPTYRWMVNGITAGTNSPSFTYTASDYLIQTPDVITCELTSTSPCASINPVTSAPVNITVNPILTASVSIAPDANNVCAGTSVTFTPTPTANGGLAPIYEWFVNGSTMGNSATYTYAPANNDAVYAVMTSNSTACLASTQATSADVVMVVNPLPIVTLAAAGPFCIYGAPIQLAGLPAGGTYSGTDVTAGGLFTPLTVGDHVITYSYTNLNGCSASNTTTITVKPRPQLQMTINGVQVTDNHDGVNDLASVSVCNGQNNIIINGGYDLNGTSPANLVKVSRIVTLNNVSVNYFDSGILPISKYGFTFAKNATLNNPALTGTLEIRLMIWLDSNNNYVVDGNECAGDWIVYTVTVNPLPAAAGAIAGNANITVGAGVSGEPYSIGAIANATSYVWSYSGTGVTINTPDPLAGNSVTLDFAADASGGTLSVKGHNACGDGLASTLDIAVTKSAFITTGFDHAGTKTTDLSAYAFRNVEIRIKGQVSRGALATLYDIQGRTIRTKILEEGDLNALETPGIKIGIYILHVNDHGKVQTFKIPVNE